MDMYIYIKNSAKTLDFWINSHKFGLSKAVFSLHVLFFIFCTIPVLSIEPYKPKIVNPIEESWRWNHYAELDGKGVKCIAEGKNSTIWFAANDGVVFYDGYSWKTYGENDGIMGGPVNSVHGTNNGIVYASTQEGIFYFDGVTWNSLFSDSIHNLEFGLIKETSSGELFCLYDKGFLRISKDHELTFYISPEAITEYTARYPNITFIGLPEELKLGDEHNYFTDIVEDDLRNMWLALSYYEKGKILKFRLESNIETFESYRIISSTTKVPLGFNQRFLKDSTGDIWIVCAWYSIGISRISGNNIIIF